MLPKAYVLAAVAKKINNVFGQSMIAVAIAANNDFSRAFLAVSVKVDANGAEFMICSCAEKLPLLLFGPLERTFRSANILIRILLKGLQHFEIQSLANRLH